MKRIVLVALCTSSLYAMDPAAKQAAPSAQSKEDHERNVQSQIDELGEKLKIVEMNQRKSHNHLARSLHMLTWAHQATAMNYHNCLVAKDKQIADLNKRVQYLEAVAKFHALAIQRWLGNEQMLAAANTRPAAAAASAIGSETQASQAAACAQPQSFQPPKLTITVSGPDDQAPITILK